MYQLTVKSLRQAYRDYLRENAKRPAKIIFCGLDVEGNITGVYSEDLKNSKAITQTLVDSLKVNLELAGEFITFDHGTDPLYVH